MKFGGVSVSTLIILVAVYLFYVNWRNNRRMRKDLEEAYRKKFAEEKAEKLANERRAAQRPPG